MMRNYYYLLFLLSAYVSTLILPANTVFANIQGSYSSQSSDYDDEDYDDSDYDTSESASKTHNHYKSTNRYSNISPPVLCPGLDPRTRFSKNLIGEIDVFGGAYTGAYTENSWGAGIRGLFHINHTFGIGLEYLYAHLYVDPISSFGVIKKTSAQNIIDAQLAIKFPILFAASDKLHLPMTLFVSLGGGTININQTWRWLMVIGGGVNIYLKPEWLSLRVDINSYIHTTPTADINSSFTSYNVKNKLGADFAVMVGLGFFFPYTPPQIR